MPTVFSAKLDSTRTQRLLGLLKGGTFGGWVRDQLDSADAQDRLAEVASETQRAVARLEAARADEEAAQARADIAEGALGAVKGQMEQLGLLAQAAVELRQELALASVLRRMGSPTEARGVGLGEAAVVLQHFAAWLRLTGFSKRTATPAPEVIATRHWVMGGPSLMPWELLAWLAASLQAGAEREGRRAAQAAR